MIQGASEFGLDAHRASLRVNMFDCIENDMCKEEAPNSTGTKSCSSTCAQDGGRDLEVVEGIIQPRGAFKTGQHRCPNPRPVPEYGCRGTR